MKVVSQTVGGRPKRVVVLDEDERKKLKELGEDKRFLLWRKYLSVVAGIKKERLFERNLLGTKDFDPRAQLGYLQALEEATDLRGVLE